jgi:hypothetical protein
MTSPEVEDYSAVTPGIPQTMEPLGLVAGLAAERAKKEPQLAAAKARERQQLAPKPIRALSAAN